MNYQEVQAYVRKLAALVPKTKEVEEYDETYEYELREVYMDQNGSLVATYQRYIGCGDYETYTDYPNVAQLLKEQA